VLLLVPSDVPQNTKWLDNDPAAALKVLPQLFEEKAKPFVETKNDRTDCVRRASLLAMKVGSVVVTAMRNYSQIRKNATVASAIYCIDGRIGSTASTSGNAGQGNRLAIVSRTAVSHDEINILEYLKASVPTTPKSWGFIHMVVNHPNGVDDDYPCVQTCQGYIERFRKEHPAVMLNFYDRNGGLTSGGRR